MTCSIPVIAIPSGKCVVKLKSAEYDNVIAWAEEVISVGRSNSVTYLPSALIFYAQQFFNIFSDEYKLVREHIIARYGNAGNVRDVIDKVNSTPLIQKPTDEDGNPLKKRRGRPPKKQYVPPTLIPKEPEQDDNVKKIKIKRK